MRCPVCKAENAQGPSCRRCKADLALLFALEEQCERALAAARRCLAEGKWREAVSHAEEADKLRGDAESRRLLAVSHLLVRDFTRALTTYSLRRSASSPLAPVGERGWG
jgi:hypothetical protein